MKPKAGHSRGSTRSTASTARASATLRSSGSAGQPVWDAVLGDKIGIRLSGAYDAPLLARHQDFRGGGPRIVIAGHHRAIGARRQDCHKIAAFEFRQRPVRGKKI